MAAKSWVVRYTPADRTEVTLQTDEGQVKKFSVQYLALLEDWLPIVRYDTAHGGPHRDVMHPDGRKDTKPLRGYDVAQAFEFALRDIERNWPAYRQRYEMELKQ